MIHKMKLNPNPFALIKSGRKDIEMRLNDDKRRQVRVQDKIEFTNTQTNERLSVVVIARHEYPTFEGLYAAFDKTRLGYAPNEEASPDDMTQYYPEEDIAKNGVVGLEFQLI